MSEKSTFAAPIGTHDVLGPETERWQHLLATFAELAGVAGFGLLISPTFEDAGVFQRVGPGSDVVRKEMYEFADKGDRRMALRPEGTASVVRAWVQHRPPLPFKAWYAAPMFRYERPQAGRYRQHHQVGAEVLGPDDPDLDVELICLLWDFYRRLGLEELSLALNTMGDAESRAQYSELLRRYFTDHLGDLAEEDREKVQDHPLRVLDSKRAASAMVVESAPTMESILGDRAVAHFDRVREGLSAAGIPFVVEPRLVRGLDYYTHTLFEVQSGALDAAQNAIGGGGRYDGLVEALGGPPTPGVGFGAGIERILLACDAEEISRSEGAGVEIFVVDTAGGQRARDVVLATRRRGIRVERAYGDRSLKAQMKAAARSGAGLAVIIDGDATDDGTVILRDMVRKEQRSLPFDHLVEGIADHLRGDAQ